MNSLDKAKGKAFSDSGSSSNDRLAKPVLAWGYNALVRNPKLASRRRGCASKGQCPKRYKVGLTGKKTACESGLRRFCESRGKQT